MAASHPSTTRIYHFPEFDFLVNPPLWINHIIDSSADFVVGTVDTGIEPSQNIPIHVDNIQDLLNAADRSMVGIGNLTVHDENIRASHEISEDLITLDEGFIDRIKDKVNQMALQLGHPTVVEPRLYKLIIYREGDHFDDHIDNEHEENMIMTLSVEFPINVDNNEEKGGDLLIEGDCVPHPKDSQVGLTLFYHDTRHRVTRVKQGHRLSLIFDVFQKPDELIPQVIQQYLPTFQQGIEQLRSHGVKRIGSPANHLYMLSQESISWRKLKGMDRIFWELLRSITDQQNVFIENIALEGNSFYFNALISIMEMGPFHVAYHHFDPEDYEYERGDEDGDEDWERTVGESGTLIRQRQPQAFTQYSDIQLCFDSKDEYRAVHPKYRMGDIVLLKSKGNLHLTYKGDEELYLGNEGFYGEIHTNFGIFADI